MNKGLVGLLAGMAMRSTPKKYQRLKAKELDDGIAKDKAEEKRRRRAERNLRNLK
jgi:hypothetical protein